MKDDGRPLRIAQVAPPLERVPPLAYGGTERIVHELNLELTRRGHEVTLFASGDSDAPGELVATVPEALRPAGFGGDPSPYFLVSQLEVLRRADSFDVIHSHLEWPSLMLARASQTPVVSTFHGRLDVPAARQALIDPPPWLVAISQSQASAHPEVPWTIIHNGMNLAGAPFRARREDHLCFVGRVAPEKGIVEALEVARLAGRPLKIAAKIGTLPEEREYYEEIVGPLMKDPNVEFLGELRAPERDQLLASSYAALMPGSWPEPFGLVAIEALACGTPLLARRVGALPEIIRDGIDGFFGDDAVQLAFLCERVEELDRLAIRDAVLDRFSASRMTDRYEQLYAAAMSGQDSSEAAFAEPPPALTTLRRGA
ncbi:MAG: glycosyltransferase family 4 protein [Chloroflexi bacterium]|nr:glycosyltransferase family 4 protein [Chloroflexota bacterium]